MVWKVSYKLVLLPLIVLVVVLICCNFSHSSQFIVPVKIKQN